jgi:nitroreductase
VFKQIARFGKTKKREKIETNVPLEIIKEIPHILKGEEAIFAVIRNRRHVKKYFAEDVSDFTVMKILDAARHSYSEGNSQPWEFVVVRDPILKEHITEACFNQKWMTEAPVFIVICSNMKIASAMFGERGIKLYSLLAAGAALQNILNAAEAMGLGANVVGNFSENRISILTQCPEYVRPAAVITLGWPAEKGKQPILNKMEDIVHVEAFGETLQLERIIKEKLPYP